MIDSRRLQNTSVPHCAESMTRSFYSFIFRAVHHGHTGVVKVLLDFSPNLEIKDNDGDTPILCAVKSSHTDIARLLVEHGANTAAKDKNLKTGLHHAIETENDEMAVLMLEASKKLVHTQDEESRTPVHYAARFDNAKVRAKSVAAA